MIAESEWWPCVSARLPLTFGDHANTGEAIGNSTCTLCGLRRVHTAITLDASGGRVAL